MTPSGPPSASDHTAALKELACRGQALTRTPLSARDLRWHVEAAFVGDFTALLAARLRAERFLG